MKTGLGLAVLAASLACLSAPAAAYNGCRSLPAAHRRGERHAIDSLSSRHARCPKMTVRSSTRGLPGLPRGRCGLSAFQASSDNQN